LLVTAEKEAFEGFFKQKKKMEGTNIDLYGKIEFILFIISWNKPKFDPFVIF